MRFSPKPISKPSTSEVSAISRQNSGAICEACSVENTNKSAGDSLVDKAALQRKRFSQ